MTKIFIGLLFIFFNYSIEINGMVIGLIPSFVGYILIFIGINEVSYLSEYFQRTKPFVIGMFLYSVILYLMDLTLGNSQNLSVPMLFVGIAALIAFYYITYLIIAGIREVEGKHQCELNGLVLYRRWGLVVVFNVLSYFGVVSLSILYIAVCALLVVQIMFLVSFYQTKNKFNEYFQ